VEAKQDAVADNRLKQPRFGIGDALADEFPEILVDAGRVGNAR
jgi:hypothetical protein